MPDPRFYRLAAPVSLEELARLGGASAPAGPDTGLRLRAPAPLDRAGPDNFSFCERPAGRAIATGAGACFVRPDDAQWLPQGVAALLCPAPRAAFSRAADRLVALREFDPDGPPVSADAMVEPGAILEPGCRIGAGAEIGAGTRIGAGAAIGPGVAIGRDCRIGSNVVVRCALIGDRVRIGSGSVVGEAGFGVAAGPDGLIDVPQLGRVVIQDDVTLGALCAVDRAAFGETLIGLACKIDNLTQIAHNARLGRGVVVAAFGGISGSVEIGDFVQLGGRAGIADHLRVGAGARIAAGSGVLDNVPDGEVWAGYPAQPRREWVREAVALRRLARENAKRG